VRLTVYTDYALRLLTYAALSPDALITVGEVAQAYGISRNHLTKVAHQLGVAGFLETVRGKGGGLRLARRPESIVLGEVVRYTEPDMALVPCFEPLDAGCRILPACVLEGILREARDAFLQVLDRHTLADLAAPRVRLRGLLGLAPPVLPAGRRPAKVLPIRSS
jgi:Rrf2 family nitric oxide-sensitive transcriptional repressor